MNKSLSLIALAATALLGACATQAPVAPAPAALVDNAALPAAVRVPAGHKQAMVSRGVGEITYECRAKAGAAGQFEWVFAGPVADLITGGQKVGTYYGGPTWAYNDGSKVTAKQVAVAPATPGSIPLQLVKADPATGQGVLQGVTYIQRLATAGGVAPAAPCAFASLGQRTQVSYAADYVFYKM